MIIAAGPYSILIAGAAGLGEGIDAGRLVDRLRRDNSGVALQVIDAGAVYGKEHVLRVLHIVFEAMRRGAMLANKPETEFLLRLACTGQIADAIRRAGLKAGRSCCFVAFSKDVDALRKLGDSLAAEFALDDSVLEPAQKKQAAIAAQLQVNPKKLAGSFADFLLERAAILVRD
jgi:tRNA threonylcarbamoyladenosine modification (KEOPS) complex Cgi121 subunit